MAFQAIQDGGWHSGWRDSIGLLQYTIALSATRARAYVLSDRVDDLVTLDSEEEKRNSWVQEQSNDAGTTTVVYSRCIHVKRGGA